MRVNAILQEAMQYADSYDFDVSDIFFRSGEPLKLKGSGKIVVPQPEVKVDPEDVKSLLYDISPHYAQTIREYGSIEAPYQTNIEVSPVDNQESFENDGAPSTVGLAPLDATTQTLSIRFRITGISFNGATSYAIIIRITAPEPWPMAKLKLPAIAENAIKQLPCGGLLLVGGGMSSGKSTTMYSAVDTLNTLYPQHIGTIEDPIEVPLPSRNGLVMQREVNPYSKSDFRKDYPTEQLDQGVRYAGPDNPTGDVPDFISGVRAAMRLSIRGLMIMEVRDSETAEAAIRAADAGLWVIAGMHGSDAVGLIEKFINYAPGDQRLDRSRSLYKRLHAVIFQALIPDLNKTHNELAAEVLFPKSADISIDMAKTFEAAFRENNFSKLQDALKDFQKTSDNPQSMLSLNQSLLTLILADKVNKEDAFLASYDVQSLRQFANNPLSSVERTSL
jgi:Tfp pilus assembly pilus retraction ATPase PilT